MFDPKNMKLTDDDWLDIRDVYGLTTEELVYELLHYTLILSRLGIEDDDLPELAHFPFYFVTEDEDGYIKMTTERISLDELLELNKNILSHKEMRNSIKENDLKDRIQAAQERKRSHLRVVK